MPQPLFSHERHAVLDRVIGTDVQNVRDHQLAHCRGLGRPAFEDDFAGVIAFREYPHDISPLDNHQRADVLRRHQLQRFVHRDLGRNGPDLAAFLPQQFLDRVHERILRYPPVGNVRVSGGEGQAEGLKVVETTGFEPAEKGRFPKESEATVRRYPTWKDRETVMQFGCHELGLELPEWTPG